MQPLREMFPVRDLHLCAFLLLSGVPLVGVRRLAPSRVEWCFANPATCEKLALDFLSGRASCNARQFVEALRRARDLRDSAATSEVNHDRATNPT